MPVGKAVLSTWQAADIDGEKTHVDLVSIVTKPLACDILWFRGLGADGGQRHAVRPDGGDVPGRVSPVRATLDPHVTSGSRLRPMATTTAPTYSIGELAELAGVSVRTLHHYDAIGLLRPSERTTAGYRRYRHGDLEDLQQILLYRELDFPLDAIRRLMLDPAFDRRSASIAQRAHLAARARRMDAILEAIDAALDATTKGIPMADTDLFEVFGEFDPFGLRGRGQGALGLRPMRCRIGSPDRDLHEGRLARHQGRSRSDRDRTRRPSRRRRRTRRCRGAGTGRAASAAHRSLVLPVFDGDAGAARRDVRRRSAFAATYERIQPGLARFVRDTIRVNAGLPAAD